MTTNYTVEHRVKLATKSTINHCMNDGLVVLHLHVILLVVYQYIDSAEVGPLTQILYTRTNFNHLFFFF